MTFLIVTDLDSTLVGNDDALKDFNSNFEKHRKAHRSKLVYATGRSLELYQDLESKVDLLQPDMLITSVGSEIYTKRDSNWTLESDWTEHLSQNWDVKIVKQITSNIKYENLRPQKQSEQGEFKVSFNLSSKYQSILEDLRQELEAKNIKAQIIYSSNKDVDILPEGSGKGNALKYVQKALGIPRSRTVACGDSGNDIDLFTDKKISGIIVGNARLELKEWHQNNQRPNLYSAESNCAEGVLEGLRYFGWL